MMGNASDVKKIARELGADLCGIASVSRFSKSPEGFNPTDLYADAKSVIVFAIRLPSGVLQAKSPVPYSMVNDISLHETHRIAFSLAVRLESLGFVAVPVPSEPYQYWDAETMTGKGLLSLRHAGQLAGLGVIGKNTLLCNEQYGNLIRLGAVLVNASLDQDAIACDDVCPESCNLCIRSCPSGALGGSSVDQKKCRKHSEGATDKGAEITVCNACRSVCPNLHGWRRARQDI
jgi:epoxyqueuosine reductase QueG